MRCVTRKLKPTYKKIDAARKELDRLIDVMPRQMSGVPEMNVRIQNQLDIISSSLLEYSNIHADWRYNTEESFSTRIINKIEDKVGGR